MTRAPASAPAGGPAAPGAPAAMVRFHHAAPQLPSRDLGATKAWYERHLGFRCVGPWEQWQFLILEREGVRLHFYPHGRDGPGDGNGPTFYLEVAGDLDGLAARMRAGGVELHDDPADQPHGMREFVVHDPDGRHVVIGKPVEGR